jgi:hypothetical protein
LGYLSLPSPTATFITTTPANSTCAVTYDVSDGWEAASWRTSASPTPGPARSPDGR